MPTDAIRHRRDLPNRPAYPSRLPGLGTQPRHFDRTCYQYADMHGSAGWDMMGAGRGDNNRPLETSQAGLSGRILRYGAGHFSVRQPEASLASTQFYTAIQHRLRRGIQRCESYGTECASHTPSDFRPRSGKRVASWRGSPALAVYFVEGTT